MLRLQCVAQNYDWGVKGECSTVGRLYSLGNKKPAIADTPYAELWMGTHPSGPSKVTDPSEGSAELLQQWIEAHPEALGENVGSKWGARLPFLFKVLSVAKALSIQAHPDKALAERLHKEQPNNYKDDNHKPEMALAVTKFEALCGFVSFSELQETLTNVPELKSVVGKEGSLSVLSVKEDAREDEKKSALKTAFTALMTRDQATVDDQLKKLIFRLTDESKTRVLSSKESLILRVEKQYPSDIGVFSIYFLNYLTLAPGEAIYLAANEPHAYLAGECIECMAASDNVVRAGLTPKYRDTDSLCTMLTYNQGLPEILKGTPLDKYSKVYSPPFDEFEVEKIVIPLGESYNATTLPGPSILLTFKGNGAVAQEYQGTKSVSGLKVGDIAFIPAGAKVEFSAVVETAEGVHQSSELELYRARVNSSVFQL